MSRREAGIVTVTGTAKICRQRQRPAKLVRASAAGSAAVVISSCTASCRATMACTFPSGLQSQSFSLRLPAGVEQASMTESSAPLVSPLLLSSTCNPSNSSQGAAGVYTEFALYWRRNAPRGHSLLAYSLLGHKMPLYRRLMIFEKLLSLLMNPGQRSRSSSIPGQACKTQDIVLHGIAACVICISKM